MTTGKTIALTRRTFFCKVMSLLLNMLSRLVLTFLPRSKRLLISWLQSPSAVILEPQKIKSDIVSPYISHEVLGPDAMIFVFWMLSFKPPFSFSSFTFSKRLFSSSSLSAIKVVSSAHLRVLILWLKNNSILPSHCGNVWCAQLGITDKNHMKVLISTSVDSFNGTEIQIHSCYSERILLSLLSSIMVS